MNLFQQAQAGLPLTPAQRALLKVVQQIFLTAIIALFGAASIYLRSNGSSFDWVQFLIFVGGAFLLALLTALAKYFTAHGDAPVGLAMEALINSVVAAMAKNSVFVQAIVDAVTAAMAQQQQSNTQISAPLVMINSPLPPQVSGPAIHAVADPTADETH